jgi:hypothetical protein
VLLPALLLAAGNAYGMEIYCRADNLVIYAGGEIQGNWSVVNSKARRPQLPGQTKPTTGCSYSGQSLGAIYRVPEIIQKPTLGHARVVSNYRVFYESAKSGHDVLGVRVHWVEWSSGKLQSAIIHMNINVVDQPL